MNLADWGKKYNIPPNAINELIASLNEFMSPNESGDLTENDTTNLVRLRATEAGWRLFRNNVGVTFDKKNRPIRYGLANETPAMNKILKSSDLIGLRPVVITPDMVGMTFGQFVALEVKTQTWEFTANPREVAQLNFLNLITQLGGYAKFTRGQL